MVFQVFLDSLNARPAPANRSRPPTRRGAAAANLYFKSNSFWANVLIALIKTILFVYDVISFPIYFLIQRPDRRAVEAQRTCSNQVDACTWIRSIGKHKDELPALPNRPARRRRTKYRGSTLSDIFANSVLEFSSRSCLGYRAVVTCPLIAQNDEGQPVLQDKSFRSDYTWYTFGQVGRRVQDIASGLYNHFVNPTSKALFLASSSLEWFCAAQACFQLAVQLVLVPEINDKSTLYIVLVETQVELVFVSCDKLGQLCSLFDHIRSVEDVNNRTTKLKRIILTDWQFSIDLNERIFAQLGESSAGLVEQILSLAQIEEAGIENPIVLSCSKALSDENLNKLAAPLFGDSVEVGSRDYCRSFSARPDSSKTCASERISRKEYSRNSSTGGSLRRRRQQRERSQAEQSSQKDKRLLGDKLALDKSPKPNDLAMIVYTYGLPGQTRPIMFNHSQLAHINSCLFLNGVIDGQDVHCATLQLDNTIEFITEFCVFSHGGSIGYSCNLNTLFCDGNELFKDDKSDLEALGPSFLLVKPYILERLRTSTYNYLQLNMNPLLSFILKNVLFEYKKFWIGKHFDTPIVNRLFCSSLKNLFGSDCKYILCCGSTDCSETRDFYAIMVDVPVIELYGPNEAIASLISVVDSWEHKKCRLNASRRKALIGSFFGVLGPSNCQEDSQDEKDDDGDDKNSFKDADFDGIRLMAPKVNRNTHIEDLSKNLLLTSSILCPTIGTRVKLEDWGAFRATDRPYPRGRLVIGGELVCSGYFNRRTETEESFYIDSNFINWFRSGDIARVFPNGSFEIISAISDLIKMIDGQFVSLSQIEHILRNSQFVDNVCTICGEDNKFVINLIVPNLRRLALKSPGEANLKMAIGTEPEPEELADIEFRREVCNDRMLCEFVNEHLQGLISSAGLDKIPNRFLLVPEIWTPETELVTPAFEPKRSAIQKFYATDIQSIFRLEFRSSSQRLSSRFNRSRASPSPSRFSRSIMSSGGSRVSLNSI